MPLTLTLTEGVVPPGAESDLFKRLCDAMLRWHGLQGHPVLTPNVVGTVQVLPVRQTFAGLTEAAVAFVEWKMPATAFATREIQRGYIEEATTLVHEASGRRHPRERIWVNVVHAVDGAWGIGGQALADEDLRTALGQP